ncbi:MAG: TorF family putative porin [Pseudomonadota bacterium]|nr:TorF family putative porin [Pseudomonadota bacterium]
MCCKFLKKSVSSFYLLSTLAMVASAASPITTSKPKTLTPSANISYVSQYLFRGIQQSNENMAIQGGFDVSHSSGLYLGTWSSNVLFADAIGAGTTSSTSIENNLYGGFAKDIGKFSLDMGGIYYLYPDATSSLDYNFGELYASLSTEISTVSLSTGINVSNEFYAKSGRAVYGNASISVPVADSLTLSAAIGRQYIERPSVYGVDSNYYDYSAGLEYAFNDTYAAGLSFVDNSFSEDEAGYVDGWRVVASLSASI